MIAFIERSAEPLKHLCLIFVTILMLCSTTYADNIVQLNDLTTSPLFSQRVNEIIYQLDDRYEAVVSIAEIGQSVQSEPLLAISVGTGPKKILIHASHHAREYMTTLLVLEQIEYIANLYEADSSFNQQSIRILLDQKVTFVFVPLVNPDGTNLVIHGSQYVSDLDAFNTLTTASTFQHWKANIRGVDLNNNYPSSYPSKNVYSTPGSEKYPGPEPFSEPETLALKTLCEAENFSGTLSYHSSGEIIFWHFNQSQADIFRDLTIAHVIAHETGYSLVPKGSPSRGNGFKDWHVETFKKPGLTIEIAPYSGNQPVPLGRYDSVWEKNKHVPFLFAIELIKAGV